MLELQEIIAATNRIKKFIHVTPILCSESINLIINKNVNFKCENFQKTGSFKARGALNAILKDIPLGVVTHSIGNHGLALAWAASIASIPCYVVVPPTLNHLKRSQMEAYGCEIVESDYGTIASRESKCTEMVAKTSFKYVDPCNDVDVMAGQGSLAPEIMESNPETEAILISIGGGGLSGGISKYLKGTNVKVYCVEVEGKSLQESMTKGDNLNEKRKDTIKTIADGISRISIPEACFAEIFENCEKSILTVNDNEIKEAMKLIFERLKVVIEPTGAVSLAALIKYKDTVLKDIKNVTLVICGGNVNIEQIGALF
uniref:L-serine ammonia-lyase n=1 Tax=Rhabditophanes sp. KR3021 TaxID=114890 RepID=A0AC35TR37_9BILA